MANIPTEAIWLIIWFLIGGFGGYAAARRRGLRKLDDLITYFTNMGGAAVAVCSFVFWWLGDTSGRLEWMLCGAAFGVGLLGVPILEKAIERGWRSAENWTRSKEPKDSSDTKESPGDKTD